MEAEAIRDVSPAPVGQGEKRSELQPARGLPANVVIRGDIEGNTVIVEPSDQHTNLIIDLRGRGNTVIVRRLCALDAVLVAADGAHIEIGESTEMYGVRIVAEEGSRCTIGARCQFAKDTLIQPSDPYRIFDRETGKRINDPRAVRIGDDVWLGEQVQVAKGCVIGPGTVVEAASLLNGDYPGYAVIAGAPGKVARTRIKWKPLAAIEP